jgi:hypothetical protein
LCFDVKSILDNTLKSNRLGLGFGDAGWIRVKYMGCGKIEFEAGKAKPTDTNGNTTLSWSLAIGARFQDLENAMLKPCF